MSRFTDVDKLIEHLKDEIKACEPAFGSRANGRSVAYGTKLGLQSAISFAETLAADDVAPKSEVAILSFQNAALVEANQTLRAKLEKAKSEVANEVIDYIEMYVLGIKIDKEIIEKTTPKIYRLKRKDYMEAVLEYLAELKKKYTEGNDERSD